MAVRSVIDLGNTPIIKDIVAKLASILGRLAPVESEQALALARATEALAKAQQALDPIGGTTPPAPTLGALSLSGALVSGTASSGSIAGATAGSTITTTVTGLTINSGARTYSFSGLAPAGSGNLAETLAGAVGSPRTTAVTVQPAPMPGYAITTGDIAALQG